MFDRRAPQHTTREDQQQTSKRAASLEAEGPTSSSREQGPTGAARKVLTLQRVFGNRAVSSMLQAGVAAPMRAPAPSPELDAIPLTAPPLPVQLLRDARGDTELGPKEILDTAARGVAGDAGPLPHADVIQRSFGKHDVQSIEAHTGGGARAAAAALGARAYATGNAVVFRDSPDLHTAAHEAAHVVQQRSGAYPSGGVGRDGDALERHANAVAAVVVGGGSAESLFDHLPTSSPAAPAVQRLSEHGKAVDIGKLSREACGRYLLISASPEAAAAAGIAFADGDIAALQARIAVAPNAAPSAPVSASAAAAVAEEPDSDDESKADASSGKRAWASGPMNDALNKAKQANKNGFDTGHHKLAKSTMRRVSDLMTAEQRSQANEALDLPRGSGPVALMSLGSNLAFGPPSGQRQGDPGRGFDPNRTASGNMSPRSQIYDDLRQMPRLAPNAGADAKSAPQPAFSDAEFAHVLGHLEAAELIHYTKTKGELLDTDTSMWAENKDGDKPWIRQSSAPIYDPTPKGTIVRDLKNDKAARPKEEFAMRYHRAIVQSKVDQYTMPLDQAALDRWAESGYTRYYNPSTHEWVFVRDRAAQGDVWEPTIKLKEAAASSSAAASSGDEKSGGSGRVVVPPGLVPMHTPDTEANEEERYGHLLLRLKS